MSIDDYVKIIKGGTENIFRPRLLFYYRVTVSFNSFFNERLRSFESPRILSLIFFDIFSSVKNKTYITDFLCFFRTAYLKEIQFPKRHSRMAAILTMLLMGLPACVANPSTRYDLAVATAKAGGLSEQRFPVGSFTLAGWYKSGTGPLVVFIEGDGYAWASRYRPSEDPTPRFPTALQLAAIHRENPVLYLARPCQFVTLKDQANCGTAIWTRDRFSPLALDALNRALDAAKNKSGVSRMILVGYSGGGVAAALLSVRRSDVEGLISIASPLDLAAWTRAQGVSPLTGSLNPADYIDKLRSIRQLHVAGSDDRVVSSRLVLEFSGRVDARVVIIDGMEHGGPWHEYWENIWGHFRNSPANITPSTAVQ